MGTAAFALITTLLCAGSASAQVPLTCGVPVSGTLPVGGTDTYRVQLPAGAVGWIQTAAAFGPVHMRLTGAGVSQNTCTGIVQFTAGTGDLTLQVSPCNPNAGGAYTLTLNVISAGAGNCGRPLGCGATPDGTGFKVAGEVDSFQISVEGEDAVIRANYLQQLGAPNVRLFDPHGNELESSGVCSGTIQFDSEELGIYTALVSACLAPVVANYRLEYWDAHCPIGPTITYFGVANAMSELLRPIGYDDSDRPIYNQQFGQGSSLVVEARAGTSRLRAGASTVPYLASGTEQDPDLQMIFSRPLGDGDPTVCDVTPPNQGGVPATVPFAFADTQPVLDHIDDMGCRFDNGQGEPAGRTDSTEACTRSNNSVSGFLFVDRGSAIQYCAEIATAWEFPDGDTIVAARVKDMHGNFGAEREIVVRIGDSVSATMTPSATPTPSATRTVTRTATRTPPSVLPTDTATKTVTRTRTPSATATVTPTGPTPTGGTATVTPTPIGSSCAGDCHGDGSVTVDEITLMLKIAFRTIPLEQCPAGDTNHDGTIGIGDLVQAVNSLLNGCPASLRR